MSWQRRTADCSTSRSTRTSPTNRLVYLSFVEGDETANRTAIWRARYENGRLADGRVIFRVAPDKAGPGHPGGRMLFLPDQTLLLTVGDGFEYKTAAQDLGSHLGKILRLTRDGKAAADNPFVASRRCAARDLDLRPPQSAGSRARRGDRRHSGNTSTGRAAATRSTGFGPAQTTAGRSSRTASTTTAPDFRARLRAGHRALVLLLGAVDRPVGTRGLSRRRIAGWKGQLLVGGLVSRSLSRLSWREKPSFFVEEERLFGTLGSASATSAWGRTVSSTC